MYNEKITSITQGCDFTLRIRAKRVATRGYVNVSFTEIDDIHVYLVNLPATKTPIAYALDEDGRMLINVSGETLDCNSYGIEIIGYYNNGNWRHQLAPAFQIVRTSSEDNYALTESDERTIDLIISIGETYLTTKGFNQAMEEHDQDIHAHNDLRSTITSMTSQISNLVTEVGNVTIFPKRFRASRTTVLFRRLPSRSSSPSTLCSMYSMKLEVWSKPLNIIPLSFFDSSTTSFKSRCDSKLATVISSPSVRIALTISSYFATCLARSLLFWILTHSIAVALPNAMYFLCPAER